MFDAAFIAPLGLRATLTSRFATKHVRRRPCVFITTTTRASAAGAGAQSGAWRPRDRSRDRDDDPPAASRPNDSETDTQHEQSTSPVNAQQKSVHSTPTKSSNRAALQVDDGTLSENPNVVVPIPRRLVRRKSAPSLQQARKSLLTTNLNSGILGLVVLAVLFAIWYASNAMFNVYNKRVLSVFPYPLTCTVAQFAIGAFVMLMLWVSGSKKAPPVNTTLIKCIAPLAVCHAAGFLLTNMALGKVSVAFTHTVKATEPFFSVALTPSILGDIPTWGIIGSLVPIVGGVALASATEASFNWIGFLCAVGSNIALQSRNILSKKVMKDAGDPQAEAQLSPQHRTVLNSLDNVNLFATMTVLALFILAPVAILLEGMPLMTAAALPHVTGMSSADLWRMLALGGVLRCADVLTSYMILHRVSPVTHSVGNCVKRAVVIAVSIVLFNTPMTPLTALGTCLALAGVLLYSLIVAGCKQNTFGPDSPMCRPVYEKELELVEGGGI